MLTYIFRKMVISTSIFLCIYGCQDIPRDNLLDPKNPNSYNQQILAVEAFVNTNNDTNHNELMLNAIDLLNEKYPNRLTILQYHRTIGSFIDPYYLDLNDILYDSYVTAYHTNNKGVPDVFINGIAARIQGATTIDHALFRLEEAIQPLLLYNGYFAIELSASRNPNQVAISTKIARLGSEAINNILVKAMLVEHIDNQWHKRVVREVLKSNLISQINPGEVKEIDFTSYKDYSTSDLKIVCTVTSQDELDIYQSQEVKVP